MTVQNIKQELIKDNPFNPRSYYNRDKIAELASSIEQIGMIEVPQARKANGHYELAYGGYRRRAYESLGKKFPKKFAEMPLDIVTLTDEQMAIFALEENLKRHDMTPIDTANAIEKYFEIFPDTTEEQLGTKLSMTQGNISNMRRVTKLPKEILDKINDGKINFTMARELLVLQGLSCGVKQEWRGGKSVQVPVDDKELMLDAVKEVTGQYGNPCTVNGIKKAIFEVARSNFKRVDTASQDYYSEKTLFDTKEAGCLKCAKMLKLPETQSQNAHFCTDPTCWGKHQTAHKKKAAEDAKRKMEADIAARVVKDIKAQPENISQEISAAGSAETKLTKAEIKTLESMQTTDLTKDATEEAINERKRRENLKNLPDYPCLKCANIGKCDGTHAHSKEDPQPGQPYHSIMVCEKIIPIGTPVEKVTKKATMEIPPELMDKVKAKAGTRAEVLDIRLLRVGSYGSEMVSGHVLLDPILDEMDNHQECIVQCTKGFHYGFDSSRIGQTYYICTNPKCCSSKKAAFTRAKNARGMLRKKIETAAIKEAVDKTEHIGLNELKLLFFTKIKSGGYSNNAVAQWLIAQLKIEPPKNQYINNEEWCKLIMPAINKLPEKELAGMLIALTLVSMRYSGDVKSYHIKTTEALNMLGVGINIPKEAKEPEKKSARPADTEESEGEDED